MGNKYEWVVLVVIAIAMVLSILDTHFKTVKQLRERADHYKRQRDNLIEFINNAQVISGVCCCGDDMQRHSNPMDCGHSPRDQWDYLVQCWLEQIEEEDKKLEKKND